MPNAEALGEVVAALIKIFRMVNDRIWALHRNALTVYPTDGLRLALSALAKLSLSIETFAQERTRTRAVVIVESIRSLLRSTILLSNGFDVLVHGGEPDFLTVQLAATESDSVDAPPKLVVSGGDEADTSQGRPLWWRGAETRRWLSMSPSHPGEFAVCLSVVRRVLNQDHLHNFVICLSYQACLVKHSAAGTGSFRRAHLPAVWQLIVSEVGQSFGCCFSRSAASFAFLSLPLSPNQCQW